MTAIAEAFCILVTARLIGLAALRLIGITRTACWERTAYATALGLGILAYGVLAIGLLGWLSIGPFIIMVVILCGAAALVLTRREEPLGNSSINNAPSTPTSHSEIGSPPPAADDTNHADPVQHTAQVPHPLNDADPAPSKWTGSRVVAAAALVAILAFAAIALVNCFVPPAAHEWDALSYHLAAPKVYIRQHRIVYLPTDHHSNFPFTMEMLFTVGLLLQGYALANLMHFAAGVLCVLFIWRTGRRYFGQNAAALAALTFAAAPITVWEAGSAYIELGLTLFAFASIAAILRYQEEGDLSWIGLAGVLAGFALSVKALALIPFAACALVLGLLRPGWKGWLVYVTLALTVGSPFYIKSWVWTGNPVYPFAYSFFGGRNWSADRAAAYATEQESFGQSANRTSVADDAEGLVAVYRKPTAAQRLRNLMLAPFDLVAIPSLFYNHNDPGVRTHLGFLWLSLVPLVLLTWQRLTFTRAFPVLAAIALIWFVAWDLSMQYVRYLLPVLGLAAVLGSAAATELVRRRVWFAYMVAAVALLQCAFTLLYYVPMLPQHWDVAVNGDARNQYLLRSVNCYGAEVWINQHTPRDAGVVLFEDTRGFYLDRPYLWGNSPHSAYIPYERFRSGRDMANWFLAHGIRYALVNLQFAPQNNSPDARMALLEAVQAGTTPSLAMEWYAPERLQGERWRALLGDAMRTGAALAIPDACSRATVVLQFTPAEEPK